MKPARIALYTVIAVMAALIAYVVLVREPHPDWPINLIHLLGRH